MTHPVVHRHHVRITGRGHPILFAHGFGCDQVMWRHVAPAFEATHRVVLFDYVGAGGADPAAWNPARYATLQGYADDVVALCDALALRDVLFVGHSVSATIGMLAAIRAPEYFARLVHIGPTPCYLDDPPDYFGGFTRDDLRGLLELMERNDHAWSRTLAPVIVGNPDRPEHAAELAASFCTIDPAIARHFAAATFLSDHRADVPRVPVPSLILQCAADAIAPATVGAWLAEQLPQATWHQLRASGHCPHLTHPQEIVGAIRAYLDTPAGAARLAWTP